MLRERLLAIEKRTGAVQDLVRVAVAAERVVRMRDPAILVRVRMRGCCWSCHDDYCIVVDDELSVRLSTGMVGTTVQGHTAG